MEILRITEKVGGGRIEGLVYEDKEIHGPAVLEEKAQVRAERGQDRAEQSQSVGERETVDLNSGRRAALSATLLLASSAGAV